MDKSALSERDICTKFITPALRKSGWDELLQIREEAIEVTYCTRTVQRAPARNQEQLSIN